MRASYDKAEVIDNVSYDDQKNPNDPNRYLRSARSEMKKETGEEKGKKLKPEYGKSEDESNEKYSNRYLGGETPDDKKLNKQEMPNKRNYMYMQ